MASVLTAGCISAILRGDSMDGPVVQILGVKKFSTDKTDRYRLLISDGKEHYASTMLATQENHKVKKGGLETNAVVRINQSIVNQLASKKILVLLDLTVIKPASEVNESLGNPVPLSSSTDSSNQNSSSNTSSSASRLTNGSNTGVQQSANTNSSPTKNIFPIISLSPYQNRWTIKARVTNKSDIRTWSNSKGEGKLFSLDLLDDSGEIHATAFNEQCDQFFDLIQVNKVYYISKASVKNANTQFTSIKNDYQMSFHSGTEVIPCEDGSDDMPMLQFNFVPINNLESLPKDSIIDLLGICKSASDLQTIVTRTTGKELQKRDIQLVDRSNTEISCTLWGEKATSFDGSRLPVIAIKGARLSEFNGRSASLLHSSVLHVNPDIKEAHSLRGWYDSEGVNASVQSLSSKSGGMMSSTNWKHFYETKTEGLGRNEKPDYFSTKAIVKLIMHENALYKACPNADCNKKVIDMNNGLYRCEKCNSEFSSFKWRLLLQVLLSDFSGSQWVTFFQEAAELIVGMSAEELGELKETSMQSNSSKYTNHLNSRCFKEYIFKLRIKMEVFKEESRLKTIGVAVNEVNYSDYGKKLIDDMKKLGINVPC